jgi:hypothetical protein
VPHETIDLAGRELPLTGGKSAEVLRRKLSQVLGVGILYLYDNTSTRAPEAAQQSR